MRLGRELVPLAGVRALWKMSNAVVGKLCLTKHAIRIEIRLLYPRLLEPFSHFQILPPIPVVRQWIGHTGECLLHASDDFGQCHEAVAVGVVFGELRG